VLALSARKAELGDGRGSILYQPLAVVRIDPGSGDYASAVPRADLLLIGLHQNVEGSRIDVTLLGQQCLERAHA
jgi:hypothetical protein